MSKVIEDIIYETIKLDVCTECQSREAYTIEECAQHRDRCDDGYERQAKKVYKALSDRNIIK